MKSKYKLIIMICTILGICSILVGTIAFYRITVEGKIKASTGNAVFVLKDENSNIWDNKEINLGKINPGDSGLFVVTMDASNSTVDMYATLEIDKGTLPTNLKFYTTSDHKSELHRYYSFLQHSGTNTETLTIYWYWDPRLDNEEDNKFVNKDNMEANIRVNAVQISEYAMMKNGVSNVSRTLVYSATEFWNDDYRPYIRTINFGNDLSNLPSECTESNLCWDISYSSTQNKKVYGYLVDSGLTFDETDTSTNTTTTKTLYNLYIVSEAPIFAPSNCNYIFSFSKYENNINTSNLESINFNNNFNTSYATTMKRMFFNCPSLKAIDLSSFNTSSVTDMEYMFSFSSSLKVLDLSGFNTSSVTDMNYMFASCPSLLSLDLSSFNTSSVTDMGYMFTSCTSLTTIDLSSFNTANVTNMWRMLEECTSLINLDLSSFNTSKVTGMYQMFSGCQSLTSLDLSSFNTSSVTNMNYMFSNCTSLANLDLSSFNTANVTMMNGMFYNCISLTNLDLSNFNTSNVTTYSCLNGTTNNGIFTNCRNLITTINIMNANVTDYADIFLNAATENGAKIIVNYTSETESLVDSMIATKSSNSNVVKGNQI